jgi:CDP-diacylglycerol--glycerol-3-phosphate 3-phosphatidyltransferase
MATLYDAKPRFQTKLRPFVRYLAWHGATANGVTVAALALSLAYGALIPATGGAAAVLLGLPVVLLIRMALNAIDGMLAREHGQASTLGAHLNEIGDVVSDAALYLPLALVLEPGWPIALAVFTGLLAEFAGLLAEFAGLLALAHGGERRYDGPLGKADRAAVFGLAAVLHALIGLSPGAVTAFFLLVAAASAVTIINRLSGGRHAC